MSYFVFRFGRMLFSKLDKISLNGEQFFETYQTRTLRRELRPMK